nr:MAG TPA: structural protein [Caudoviricetes sp.]
MANILDRYGIKEVADVTFYDLNDDGSRGAPVLYLDTLKVSTIEQTAEEAEARGGKGNPPLIIWDYGKEITVTLEDALFSVKSMAIMFGDDTADELTTITKTRTFTGTSVPTEYELPGGKTVTITSSTIYDATGSVVPTNSLQADTTYFQTFNLTVTGSSIEISAQTFPGTYYVTGDTYARSETTGKDEFFQFIIPKAKVQSENTITLEAEGDPSVFNMNLRVMRPADGVMMKLVKYDLGE